MEYYKLKETFKGDITLNPNTVDSVLVNPKNVETGVKPVEEDELFETIIKKINDKFQGTFWLLVRQYARLSFKMIDLYEISLMLDKYTISIGICSSFDVYKNVYSLLLENRTYFLMIGI
ncbi:MAG: hypothetical protein ACQEWV_26255 [Bacillota bacterium]